jgi:beta-glucosidase
MQENGVIATVKHFIGNEQEEYRMDIIPHGLMKALSSNIDDRTLHELYSWPFAEAIRAGVGAVMIAYNDGLYSRLLFFPFQLVGVTRSGE